MPLVLSSPTWNGWLGLLRLTPTLPPPSKVRRSVAELPFSRPFYDEDQITDRSERFLAAELIREALTERLHQELPYALTVEIEQFKREEDLLRIAAIIWVERESQKQIAIGKGGRVLKHVGGHARRAMEELFGEKVFLQTFVKDSNWIHVDIAGPSSTSKRKNPSVPRGGTGFAVASIVEYVTPGA